MWCSLVDQQHPTEGWFVSRTQARHRKPPRSSPARRSAAARHRQPSPFAAALPNKPARAAAAAVAGSALVVSAWPAAAHWMKHAPLPAGAGQADALGRPAVSAHRGPGRPRPAASPDLLASQQAQIVSIAVASRPGRHRRPGHAGQRPAGQQAAGQQAAGPSHAPPSAPAAPVYLNPLRGVGGLIPERIDQGVDFAGSGPVYAIGDAVITNAANGPSTGWPGGGWITYQLTDGPDAGLVVYVAEDVTPTVQVGQHVSPATVIADMFAGSDGIETGWAQPGGLDTESVLPQAGGIGGNGPFPTRVGVSFDQLLQSLGVPAAPNSSQPPYGLLPPNYPAS